MLSRGGHHKFRPPWVWCFSRHWSWPGIWGCAWLRPLRGCGESALMSLPFASVTFAGGGSVMGVPLPLLSRGNGDTFAAHLQQIGPRRVSDVSRASPGPDVQPICPNPVASPAQLAQKCTRCIRATDVSGYPILGARIARPGVQMCQDLTPSQTDGPPSPL